MTKNYYPLYAEGRLDEQTQTVLEQIEKANGKPLIFQTIKEARDGFLDKFWLGDAAESININLLEIEGGGGKIPLRVYTPLGEGPFSILLFFHGGGFVLGSLEEFDPFCSQIAAGANCVVVSVGYRLAPEHKHPAAVEDAISALEWISANADKVNGDPQRIAVGGDSAGGNLSAVLTIIAREKGIKLICQVLICPWLFSDSFNRDSYNYFGEGLWLSTKNMRWYKNHYLQNDEQAKSYLVSPGLIEDVTGFPPALVLTAEFDVLHDEGEEYANRLKEAGIQVKYFCYEGMLHDFVILPGKFDRAKLAIKEICDSLKEEYKK